LKEIVVISGKGGTGKTSIVGAFAVLADNAVLADCDVDAADLHLLLEPDVQRSEEFSGGKQASIVTEQCIGCGRCEEVCNFGAALFNGPGNGKVVSTYTIDPIACEGCGVCTRFCPVDAINFEDAVNGSWFISETRAGPMVHARLGPGEENSGKLVSLIRKEAKRVAEESKKDLIIVDGSPGIGCPVIASITGADLVLVVSEPTISGQHDLERVIELASHFGIPASVCVNKYDINEKMAELIEQRAKEKGVTVAGRIAYDAAVTKAQIAGKSIVEYSDNGVANQVVGVWRNVLGMLESQEGTEQ